MRKLIYIAVLVVGGMFTSCTDSDEENVELIQNQYANTGGDEDQDPDEEPDFN